MNLWYATPAQCRSQRAWRWYTWRIRKGWDGTYEVGFRLFGLEVSWLTKS